MIKYIFTVFIIITASLSSIACLGQLFAKENKSDHYILSARYACLTVLQIQILFLITGKIFEYPLFFFLNVTVLYILGVILYFSFLLVTMGPKALPEKKSLFFIPSCFAFIFDLYYLTLPETEKILILSNLFSGKAYEYSLYIKMILAGAGIQATVYWTILLKKIARRQKTGEIVVLPGINMINIFMSIIAINCAILWYIFSLYILFLISCVILGSLVIEAVIIRERYPEIADIIFPKTKKKYTRSNLTGIKTEDLYLSLMELIEVEKVYADENISLMDVADELSITPHQLSEFLNERLNCNFYSFINQHRIKEAVRLLIEEPERTILSISNKVGFNSKSSFYDFFYRIMEMTPSQYRTRYLKKNAPEA